MYENQNYYRTTPARTGKMMAIMVGICIAGGLIFFSMWDYWISEPAPIVAIMAERAGTSDAGSDSSAVVPTGVSHEFTLNFVESADFRILAFNTLPEEPGANMEDLLASGDDCHTLICDDNGVVVSNPDIVVNSGDQVTVKATNLGRSFHSFGVVSDPADFNSVIWDSGIGSGLSPLKPNEDGSVTFIAGPPGVYDYICTVPGHALQGMQGVIIVEE